MTAPILLTIRMTGRGPLSDATTIPAGSVRRLIASTPWPQSLTLNTIERSMVRVPRLAAFPVPIIFRSTGLYLWRPPVLPGLINSSMTSDPRSIAALG